MARIAALRTSPPTPMPVKRAGRPPREIAAQLGDRILSAAETLFLQQGYGATTIGQIATQIGATKRTVYVRFIDKAGLFHAVVKRVLDARRPRIKAIAAECTVDKRLHDMALGLLSYALDPDVVRVLRVVTAEAHRFPELNRMIEEQAAVGVAWTVEQVLADEVRLGRLRFHDTSLAARLLLSLITGVPGREASRGAKPLSRADRQQWAKEAIALFLDGARATKQGISDPG